MGYSFAKFPHAYWKKFAHGSALVSINCLSRPGSSGGFLSGEELFCAGAVNETAIEIRTAMIHARFVIGSLGLPMVNICERWFCLQILRRAQFTSRFQALVTNGPRTVPKFYRVAYLSERRMKTI